MALFSVTYDLVKDKDYQKLIDRLKELDTVKVQMSQWLLSADNTAEEVKNHLKEYTDEDDRLMVVKFSTRPSFTKAFIGTNDWLDEHL